MFDKSYRIMSENKISKLDLKTCKFCNARTYSKWVCKLVSDKVSIFKWEIQQLPRLQEKTK